jgi:VWFA-related protein
MRHATLLAFALVLAVLATLTLAPLHAQRSSEPQFSANVQVEAVVVPVTVRTASGRVVDNVAPRRFHLYIDGIEVPIQDLAPESGLPLSLGFVLDTSGSMAGRKLRSCRRLIDTFLEQRRPRDEVALWTFGHKRVLERFPFGTGWYLLPRILDSIRPWATTALYDMLKRIPDVVAEARWPRQAAVFMTDGVDNASKLSREEALELVRQLRTPVYVMGVEPPPAPTFSTGPSYEEVLRLIAEGSGGSYRRIPEVRKMPKAVRELRDELSSRFLISFDTSGVGQRRWRSIEVKVDGYVAHTRQGYFGTLP